MRNQSTHAGSLLTTSSSQESHVASVDCGGFQNTVWEQVLVKIVCKTSYMQWSPSNADTIGTTIACLECAWRRLYFESFLYSYFWQAWQYILVLLSTIDKVSLIPSPRPAFRHLIFFCTQREAGNEDKTKPHSRVFPCCNQLKFTVQFCVCICLLHFVFCLQPFRTMFLESCSGQYFYPHSRVVQPWCGTWTVFWHTEGNSV